MKEKLKKLSFKEKVKKISKYTCNILCIINLALILLSPVWGWNITKIIKSISIITGICGTYLTTGKIFEEDLTEVQENFSNYAVEDLINEEGSVENVVYDKNKTSK
jgi:hypothetical protein